MITTLGSRLMAGVQKLGRSLMLPIAVLPIAGLLLRLGQEDLLDIAFIASAGDAIFANLALIFAIGVSVGLADDDNGAAGLAGVIGYLVLQAVLETLNPDIDMGVLGGIIIGSVAGLLYNRYKTIKLPDYLAFFGGRRFIPIATGLSAVLLGGILGLVWPPIQQGIDQLGQWLIDAGNLGLFVYGVLNRILIVTGLHHVLNSFVWFVFGTFEGARGDLDRFFAGDPTAGSFMAGFFPVMMFGLPAAALAMYRTALKDRRAQVGGLLLSLALTAFLTGVTEPIEFSFMFLAPLLYALHAVLTGLSMVVMNLLDVKLGFTFSAGAFDYALSYGLSTNGWLMIPVGLLYFALYYTIFSWAIRRFNLPTPGREPETAPSVKTADGERGPAFVDALGGVANLVSVGACTTRLRLVMNDDTAIDEPMLKALGARGILHLRGGGLQVILGPIADAVADDIRAAVQAHGESLKTVETTASDAGLDDATLDAASLESWLSAVGGKANVRDVSAVATTRLRLELAERHRLDEKALDALGVAGIQVFESGIVHLVTGRQAGAIANGLKA